MEELEDRSLDRMTKHWRSIDEYENEDRPPNCVREVSKENWRLLARVYIDTQSIVNPLASNGGGGTQRGDDIANQLL